MSRPAARRIPWTRITSAIKARLDAGSGAPSVSAVALHDSDPYRVLVATMISLRTKDEVTRRSADALLGAAPSPGVLAAMPEARIARLIYPAGFYRTKARSLRETARLLVQRHEGRVPRDMDMLLALPGVGRKTANLVLNLGFGIPAICVDTHVHRISNRMGWVRTKSPAQTEQALMAIMPKRLWIPINELLVRYGQTVCTPLSPWCSRCPGGAVVRACRRGEGTVRVTAGIIERDGKVLIGRRKPGKHMGGKWEFPGGKIEPGETPEQSLARELEEELSVRAEVGRFLCRARYDGDGISLELLVYRVEHVVGDPVLREHQELRWVAPGDLALFDLADSDRKVVEALYR